MIKIKINVPCYQNTPKSHFQRLVNRLINRPESGLFANLPIPHRSPLVARWFCFGRRLTRDSHAPTSPGGRKDLSARRSTYRGLAAADDVPQAVQNQVQLGSQGLGQVIGCQRTSTLFDSAYLSWALGDFGLTSDNSDWGLHSRDVRSLTGRPVDRSFGRNSLVKSRGRVWGTGVCAPGGSSACLLFSRVSILPYVAGRPLSLLGWSLRALGRTHANAAEHFLFNNTSISKHMLKFISTHS